MDNVLDAIATKVRRIMIVPAKFLNAVSGGILKPNHITLVSLLGFFWIFMELTNGRPVRAGILLIIFGLMDSLDGALSRVQKSSSHMGMLYDSVSDRVKELILYSGIARFLQVSVTDGPDGNLLNYFYSHQNISHVANWWVWLPVAVCGLSITVSYVRARGETVLVAAGKHSPAVINKIFKGGIARYEVRTALIVLGLLTGSTLIVLFALLVLLSTTIVSRVLQVKRALGNV